MTDMSTPAYTHISGHPVSHNVINRPTQQVLSLCLLLTANYKALQVCTASHTFTEKLIQYQPLLRLCSNLCSPLNTRLLLLEAYALSNTYTHTWKCYSPPGAPERAVGTTAWKKEQVSKRLIALKRERNV